MGFYKNTGGIEEYNSKDIDSAYIPAGKPFLFTYTERCIGGKEIRAILVPHIVDDEERDCEQCFFRSLSEVEWCPACIHEERKDGKDVAFSALQIQ